MTGSIPYIHVHCHYVFVTIIISVTINAPHTFHEPVLCAAQFDIAHDYVWQTGTPQSVCGCYTFKIQVLPAAVITFHVL